ncbi:hypothetical protein M8J77_002861 [Diaphorina citri]|nr:hypothetical protein M8J77_002861 [Diaphorina citri]
MNKGQIPSKLKHAKIIALLKPGKPEDSPSSYRPIALLSSVYKLLERLLYNRISTKIFNTIPIEQAGFRPGRNCADQVLAFTTLIEAGFQKKLKTSVALIDLSAAYDTVWREGLLFKLLQVIPCQKIMLLINNMLANRTFQLILGDSTSSKKILNNGLAQGSVLAPLLFALYIADIPETKSHKFGYADDWALATSSSDVEETEEILTEDLHVLSTYFRKWRLKPNPSKTERPSFKNSGKTENTEQHHLETVRMLLGCLSSCLADFSPRPCLLCGRILCPSLVKQLPCEVSRRSTEQHNAHDLWFNPSHPYALATCPEPYSTRPPHLRRQEALLREFRKIVENQNLPIHGVLADARLGRLISRHAPVETANNLVSSDFDILRQWCIAWDEAAVAEAQHLPCIETQPPGFELTRRLWVTLNRIRTKFGKCAANLHKWGLKSSAACDCGAEKQTILHIMQDCPRRRYSGDLKDFSTLNQSAINYINQLDLNV